MPSIVVVRVGIVHSVKAFFPLSPCLRKPRDQVVTNTTNTVLELIEAPGAPVSMLVDSVSHTTRESDVKNISLVMSTASIDTIPEAGCGQRNRSFANERRAVITVLIAPDAVELVDKQMLARSMLTRG